MKGDTFMGFLFKSRKQREAEFLAPQLIKHIEESINIINTTKILDTFFFRYEFLIDELNRLNEIQKYLKFNGENPNDLLKRINDTKVHSINDFIDRYYNETSEQILKLKTEKAKQKRIDNFKSNLTIYFNQMERENINKIDELIIILQNKLNLPTKEISLKSKENNTLELNNLKWYIMISFGKSSSQSYEKAVYLAKNSPIYKEQTEKNGNTTHSAIYNQSKEYFFDFIILYDLVASWKSTLFIINGEVIDKKQ